MTTPTAILAPEAIEQDGEALLPDENEEPEYTFLDYLRAMHPDEYAARCGTPDRSVD